MELGLDGESQSRWVKAVVFGLMVVGLLISIEQRGWVLKQQRIRTQMWVLWDIIISSSISLEFEFNSNCYFNVNIIRQFSVFCKVVVVVVSPLFFYLSPCSFEDYVVNSSKKPVEHSWIKSSKNYPKFVHRVHDFLNQIHTIHCLFFVFLLFSFTC